MDSNRTPDLSKLSRISRSPLISNTGAPDLSQLSILSRNSNTSDADKLARLGERSSNFGRHQSHLKDSSSPSPLSQHAGATRMYVHYTLSEDRSGSVDEVMAQRLKALSCREKEVEESPWLQCLWAGCRDLWHRDQSSLSWHVDRHVESMGNHFFCRWQECEIKDIRFPNRFRLWDHVIVHTGLSYHICNRCESKNEFSFAEDRDRHIRTVHGGLRDGRNVIDAGADSRVGVSKLPPAEGDAEPGALDLRVLIVDHNETSQDALRRKLNGQGIHDVTMAIDGPDALTKLDLEKPSSGRCPFDFVFVDIMMPNTHGIRATQDIRMTGWEVPIIGLTMFSYNKEYCIKAGVSDFLARPIRREALRNVLTRYYPLASPEVTHGSGAEF